MGMKNRKFLGKRGLSVLLSLALCMGMASPAFAASFKELQGAIDTGVSVYKEGMSVDSEGEGAEKYKIEASKDENGVSVKLWEDVECNKSKGDKQGIKITGSDKNVTLDLNGNTIDLNPGYELDMYAKFRNKETGEKAENKELNFGHVISVMEGSHLTVNDSSAIKTDAEGKAYYDADTGKGQIKGGNEDLGGGVFVYHSSFTMNGGSITGNSSSASRGGGINCAHSTIELNGANISNNHGGDGGGICLLSGSSATIKGSVVSGNKAGANHFGGGIYAHGNFDWQSTSIDISDSRIEGNQSPYAGGGGIFINGYVTLNMANTEVNNNSAKTSGGAIRAGVDTQISLEDVSFNSNSASKHGGALYLGGADVTVTDSVTFGNNTAADKSNNIYINDSGESDPTVVTINQGGKLIDKDNNSETIYPNGTNLVKDDDDVKSTGSSVTKTVDEKNSTVTIVTNDGTKDTSNKTFQVTDPKQVVVDRKDGTTTIPGSSKTTVENSETTYPKGAEIDINGSIKGDSVTKTDNADGTITIINKAGENEKTHKVEVPEKNKGDVKVDSDGSTTIPAGSKVTDESGSETPYPDGATIDAQGNIIAKDHNYQLKETKDATCTEAASRIEVCTICGGTKVTTTDPALGHDYQVTETKAATCTEAGSQTEVCSRCQDKKVTTTDPALDHDYTVTGHADATCMENGFTTETCTRCQDERTTVLEAPGHTEEPIPAVAPTETESGWTEGLRCSVCGEVLQAPVEIPATGPVTPETPDVPGGDDDFGDAGAGTATIDEAEVPLAGIVLVKDVLAELYKHAGSPDGADAEGEYVKAIAWAIANNIVAEDTDVDAVVTVAVLKEMLTNYAASVGGALAVSIDGADDDVVMNCGEILAEVFKTL